MLTLEKYILRIINCAIVFCLAAMMIMVFTNVVLRYGFNSGITFTEEVSRILFVWLTFLGAIVAMKDRQHIAVDSFIRKLPRRGQIFCSLLSNSLILFVCYLLFDGSLIQAEINIDTKASVTGIPMALLYITGVITSCGIACYVLRDIYCLFKPVSVESRP